MKLLTYIYHSLNLTYNYVLRIVLILIKAHSQTPNPTQIHPLTAELT